MNSPSIADDEPGAGFTAFVRVVVKTQFGGKQANLARALGLSPGRVTRLVQGSGSLSVEKCLELAAATGENSTRTLTLAGKPHVAELIHLLYGKVLVAQIRSAVRSSRIARTARASRACGPDRVAEARSSCAEHRQRRRCSWELDASQISEVI